MLTKEKVDNKVISEVLEITGKLLTLHGRDENKAKTFGAASFAIDRMTEVIADLSEADLLKIRGIGKSTVAAIVEIQEKGTLEALEDLIAITPQGVLEMFKVKGLGVKKIKTLWEELGIDNLNELRIACENDSISKTKGFGQKTQESILQSLVFLQAQEGKLRMNKAEELAEELLEKLSLLFKSVKLVGQIPRRSEVVDKLNFLVVGDAFELKTKLTEPWLEDLEVSSPFTWRGNYEGNKILVEIQFINEANLTTESIIKSSSESHLAHFNSEQSGTFYHFLKSNSFSSEQEAYEAYSLPYVPSDLREGSIAMDWLKENSIDELVTWEALKGTVHNHSTYSDGKNTLMEMAKACQDLGLEYFGIADHSQTAAYAGGLLPGKVVQQWEEIDKLNETLAPFKILKGIESDILSDGSLDYEKGILKGFDYVVASVHSGMNMTKEQGTNRLIKAIENPFTTILGHPTGRLLLSRDGYPLDFKKIIDACAANQVVMELNASPYRLDIDWRWIPYCIERGVQVSINPDAHSIPGLQDMKYGVDVARKGLLTKGMTFNALGLKEMEAYLKK